MAIAAMVQFCEMLVVWIGPLLGQFVVTFLGRIATELCQWWFGRPARSREPFRPDPEPVLG